MWGPVTGFRSAEWSKESMLNRGYRELARHFGFESEVVLRYAIRSPNPEPPLETPSEARLAVDRIPFVGTRPSRDASSSSTMTKRGQAEEGPKDPEDDHVAGEFQDHHEDPGPPHSVLIGGEQRAHVAEVDLGHLAGLGLHRNRHVLGLDPLGLSLLPSWDAFPLPS